MRPRLLESEQGFGVIEVLVSALIVVIISLAMFSAIDAAGRTADTNRDRGAAANVAQADQERMRGMTITQLNGLNQSRTETADKQNYYVRSQASYVLGSATSQSCSSQENAPRYLKMTSTVTWDSMRNVKPVVQESLRAVPVGATPGKGSLAVKVVDRTATGVPNQTVSISGPSSASVVTNSAGCAVFGFIPVGTYSISSSQAGYVEAPLPNDPAIADTVTVATNAIASTEYQYDQAGTIGVTFKTTSTAGGTTEVNQTVGGTGRGFTIANASLGSPGFRAIPRASNVATGTTGATVFPFTSNYEVWAGECAGARPPGGTNAPVSAGTLTKGGSLSYNVRMPKLSFQAVRTKQTGSGTENIPDGTPATLTSTSSGCSAVYTGTVTSGRAVFDVPYGAYTLCMQWAATSNRGTSRTAGFSSDTQNGKLFNNTGTSPTVPVVPTSSSTSVAGC